MKTFRRGSECRHNPTVQQVRKGGAGLFSASILLRVLTVMPWLFYSIEVRSSHFLLLFYCKIRNLARMYAALRSLTPVLKSWYLSS